ncbi:MAG: hypothetical protein CM1200mP30_20970 [Pseudomonadota bacterium]|nr:MAG: hypothetical protein CM1200mP30_20970 [Pseudomonadota bacterium]
MRKANELRKQVSGDEVTYTVNRNINYTNVCYFRCGFCAFSKGKMSENPRGKPYDLSLNEIVSRKPEKHGTEGLQKFVYREVSIRFIQVRLISVSVKRFMILFQEFIFMHFPHLKSVMVPRALVSVFQIFLLNFVIRALEHCLERQQKS